MHDTADALAARLHLDRATIMKIAREMGRQRRITVAKALDSMARCRSCGDDGAGLDSPALTTVVPAATPARCARRAR